LFFIIGLVDAKGQSLKEYKADTVYFYASNDEIEDCIISKRIFRRPNSEVKLTIRISEDSAKYKIHKKTIDLGDGVTNAYYDATGDFLTQCISYDRTAEHYSCSIYKYFPSLDDWYYYGVIEDYDFLFHKNGWENPYLTGIALYADNRSNTISDNTNISLPLHNGKYCTNF